MSTPVRDSDSWNIDTLDPRLHAFVFGDELADLADERDDIVLLTADLRTSNRTTGFFERHPDRFIELGIAEQNMMGVAAGLAASGFRSYVSTFASFASLLCAEHLRTDLAYTRSRVRVLAHHAGVAMGFYGTSHHAIEDIALTRAIPGMTVIAPCDANATRALLRGTVDHEGPIYIRLGRGTEQPVYDGIPEISRGAMPCLRSGRDLSVIATGIGVQAAVAAARTLATEGIDIAVYDAAYLKPLSEGAVLEAAGTGIIVTVEEHNTTGGLGTAVADVLVANDVRCRLHKLGIPDEFAPVAPPTHLYRHYGLTAAGVAQRVREILHQ